MTKGAPPLRVGVIGAGPWATWVHAPTFARGPETVLSGVWSRTPANAERLANAHRAPWYPSVDALIDDSDALAIAVPPFAQPELAIRAARRGRAVLLDKPVALDADRAERVADVIGEHGVGSMVVFTYRLSGAVRSFLDRVRSFAPIGARASFISGAFLADSPYAGGWRDEHGLVVDVGPHLLDLVDVALGPVVELRATGDRHRWVEVVCQHESGARSTLTLSCSVAVTPSITEIDVYGGDPPGMLHCDARAEDRRATWATLRREFAHVAATHSSHDLDVHHGVVIQRLVDQAQRQLMT